MVGLGAGYALVPVDPAMSPSEGGGPIRVAPGSNVVRAHAGNTVYRSPHRVVHEPAPGGGRWVGYLANMMFLPDGRLVPRTAAADDMFRGADGGVQPLLPRRITVASALAPSMTMVLGAGVGGLLSRGGGTGRQALGVLAGATAGGILGWIFR